MKFWQIYRVISRRRWLVLGIVAVTLIAIYGFTAGDKAYYRATAQIMPSETAIHSPILPSPSSSGSAPLSNDRAGNQLPNLMSLLKSRQVAERTIEAASLNETADNLILRTEVGTADNPGARTRIDEGTDIIQITVNDQDPKNAVRTVNTMAQVFSGFYQELSHQEALDNLRFLETEMIRAQTNLDRSEAQLKDFKRANNISSVADVTGSAPAAVKQALVDRDNARAAFAESQAKLSRIDQQLRSMGPTRTVVEGTSDTPMVQQLQAQLAQFTRDLNDARSKYEDTHPRVITLKNSISEVQNRLREEQGKVSRNVTVIRNPVYESLLADRARISYERDGLAARAAQANAAVARVTSDLKPGTDVTLMTLENNYQRAQQNLTTIESQVSQSRINVKETTSTGAIRVIDQAEAAVGPIGTNRRLFMLLGMMLSLILGVGVAMTLESLDNRIRSNIDLESLLDLPVTALIPNAGNRSDTALARITYTDPLSPIAEAYRFLRTDILLSSQLMNAKTIMIATAKPGQGGTNTVANLAISLALDGKRVVLVDGDMRRPTLHRFFKLENELGLSSILSNEKDFEDVIFSTEVDNLLLIPAGPAPSNPSELLGSRRMRELVTWLSEHADYVLFDSPAAIAFTDAVVLSQIVDGVVLVVRARQVSRGAELRVRTLLSKANATILGVVLNDVQPETVDSYYYHSHYYPDVGKAQAEIKSLAGERSLPPVVELDKLQDSDQEVTG
ncbi:MAG TPA: polysaccharide biosynthesis tyrosine autokinase [Armatimonadota bacterium]